MTTLTELCTFFEQDDLEKIKEAMEECGSPAIITAAIVFSTKERRLSPYAVQMILQEVIEVFDVCHAVWLSDEVINGDNDLIPRQQFLDLIAALALVCSEPKEDSYEILAQKFSKVIGTCSEPEFMQILSFLAKTDMIVMMPDEVMLATLERIKRVLRDDRTFFLIIHSAIVANLLEDVLTEVASSQELDSVVLTRLEKQGYRVETIPEIGGAYMVNVPDEIEVEFGGVTDISTMASYEPITSRSDWFSQHPRRRCNRRREL